jgi:hypothetical protein
MNSTNLLYQVLEILEINIRPDLIGDRVFIRSGHTCLFKVLECKIKLQ